MAPRSRVALAAVVGGTAVMAQQPGTMQAEVHPRLAIQECDPNSGCQYQEKSLTIDANWRWANVAGKNCYLNTDEWDQSFCPDGETCARQCGIEGANYESTYGVSSSWDSVNLKFVTKTQYSNNYGSRLYLMEDDDTYKMFKLLNKEFTFTVDASQLTCGLNGALYFVEMDAKGDMSATNTAGAKYGTGYCDAQCPHDVKWIKGSANSRNWNNTAVPPVGHYGCCCAEMDLWEANSRATAYTPHPCQNSGSIKCEGTTCGDTLIGQRYDGVCDKDGCDYNNYRMGEKNFYGKGAQFQINTEKPVTVVTQFITDNGQDNGNLVEVKRIFLQDGKVIENSVASILGDAKNSITDDFCSVQKNMFGDTNDFARKGGLKQMGEAMDRGMVLVISLWDDTQVNMLWLDSTYPTNVPSSTPGVSRGPCAGGESSKPAFLRSTFPDSSVRFSGIKYGPIGSTYNSQRRLEAEEEAAANFV
eukprot:CAMPEP_0206443236 /NCGR_PEP_ID=MMETSP0324_2-20121206/14257_1 /ASSEMBLY_ACC=CAM_ASM_000836 /TAXON_ID=2866 /ORGANISM="Crypthecodinium cohnii, Strain Seligo" /LENGTH=472 /DNA_ID=CAMNT_0053911151 /DNA_START=61 /DNA_END=1479 /DNA_ORIENTATION=-